MSVRAPHAARALWQAACNIPFREYISDVGCEVEHTDEFGGWGGTLTEAEQEDVAAYVMLLAQRAWNLGFPHSSGIAASRHPHMLELRVQSGGKPFRVFYAFDPRRTAILLIGGDKTGNDRFYEEYVPIADKLYDVYLEELAREGLI